ncbi:MAG TPA: hypothetical protein VF525_14120 [Pyrinomonadaceae bacterium]|jgi:hypothetical protein
MRSWLKIFALAALLLTALVPARADVPRPRDEPKPQREAHISTPMRIEPNPRAKEARLLIPRAVWEQMRAGLAGNDAQSAATTARGFTLGAAQTAMAGLFLSLAFAFGGVWFVRARRPTNKLTSAALGVALLAVAGGATASIVYANAGPPPVARSLTSKILTPEAIPYGVYGQVKVELVEGGDFITLVLPPQAGK